MGRADTRLEWPGRGGNGFSRVAESRWVANWEGAGATEEGETLPGSRVERQPVGGTRVMSRHPWRTDRSRVDGTDVTSSIIAA